MLGFGTPEKALFQCCKELIDNAVAACVSPHGSTKSISLSLHTNDINFVIIEIVDDGSGIADVNVVTDCFTSTQDDPNKRCSIKGRFGIGLKACFLYSQFHCRRPMRFVSQQNLNEP
jgi:DNA topoisomerase VI subunit B